jgi:serine/threonine protein kinase
VFEYVPGGDLTRLIRCWHQSRPAPDRLVRECVRLLYRLSEIVEGAHTLGPPVVHRDLKPSNVLLQPSGPNRVRLRVADFGIGGVAARQAIARTTSASEALTIGLRGAHTPLYASPQQREGQAPDPRDDVFALGVVGYQALVGDTTVSPPAYMADELRERQVPDSVVRLLEDCLSEEPEDRPASAPALTRQLEQLLQPAAG